MKNLSVFCPMIRTRSIRRGFAAQEVVVAAAVVLTFAMGLYFLAEKGFSRLYHFIATMVGSPYL